MSKKILPEQPIRGRDAWRQVILPALVQDGRITLKRGEWVIRDDTWLLEAWEVNEITSKYLAERDQ
jgi:hypothetical protein